MSDAEPLPAARVAADAPATPAGPRPSREERRPTGATPNQRSERWQPPTTTESNGDGHCEFTRLVTAIRHATAAARRERTSVDVRSVATGRVLHTVHHVADLLPADLRPEP